VVDYSYIEERAETITLADLTYCVTKGPLKSESPMRTDDTTPVWPTSYDATHFNATEDGRVCAQTDAMAQIIHSQRIIDSYDMDSIEETMIEMMDDSNEGYVDFIYQAMAEQLGNTFEEVKEVFQVAQELEDNNAAVDAVAAGTTSWSLLMEECVMNGKCLFETT